MRIRMLSTVAVLSLMLAACPAPGGGAATTGTPEDEAALSANGDAWATAWNARDAAAIAALMSSDYHEVTPMGVHYSSAAEAQAGLAAEFAQMPAGVTIALSNTFTKFIDGNNAYTGGTWTTTGMPAGMPTQGSYLVISVKDSTGWKIASGLGSTDVTPMMPAMPADTTAM
jgi:ketosteroid isomerase-like protein